MIENILFNALKRIASGEADSMDAFNIATKALSDFATSTIDGLNQAANDWADTEGGYMSFVNRRDIIDTFKAGASWASDTSTSSNSIEQGKQIFGKAKVKQGWYDAGREFLVIGRSIIANRMEWTPIVYEGEEDPTYIKTSAVEFIGNSLSKEEEELPYKKEFEEYLKKYYPNITPPTLSKEEGKDELTDYGKAVRMAKRFHELYEEYAPLYGYETRKETRDFNEDSPNGKLMIAVWQQFAKENGLKGE